MANEQINEERQNKKVTPFRKAYQCSKLKRLNIIINEGRNNPGRKITSRENWLNWFQAEDWSGREPGNTQLCGQESQI